MKTEFIQCETIEQATRAAPWAAIVVEVDGGFKAFEEIRGYEIWSNQQ